MAWFTDVFIFIMVWWTVLFAILPLGVRVDTKPDMLIQGEPVKSGAPQDAGIKRKMILNTAVTTVLWLIIRTIIVEKWITW